MNLARKVKWHFYPSKCHFCFWNDTSVPQISDNGNLAYKHHLILEGCLAIPLLLFFSIEIHANALFYKDIHFVIPNVIIVIWLLESSNIIVLQVVGFRFSILWETKVDIFQDYSRSVFLSNWCNIYGTI